MVVPAKAASDRNRGEVVLQAMGGNQGPPGSKTAYTPSRAAGGQGASSSSSSAAPPSSSSAAAARYGAARQPPPAAASTSSSAYASNAASAAASAAAAAAAAAAATRPSGYSPGGVGQGTYADMYARQQGGQGAQAAAGPAEFFVRSANLTAEHFEAALVLNDEVLWGAAGGGGGGGGNGGNGGGGGGGAFAALTQDRSNGAGPEPLEDDDACVVCMEALRGCILVPCGHLAMCVPCAEEVQRKKGHCPLCRTPIAEIVNIEE